jgi:ubiquinol-cytochrome c reductase iron-sulfur subunit
MYDPVTGTAFAGPASLQAPPSDTLPELNFEADAEGNLFVLPPIWGPNKNGVVGYGRFAK